MNPRTTTQDPTVEMRLDFSPADVVTIGDVGANDPSTEQTKRIRCIDALALAMEDSGCGF